MAAATDLKSMLRQNLEDAGCGAEIIRRCEQLSQNRESGAMIRLLTGHRHALLETLHEDQKRLDCLDYLLYTLEKQSRVTTQGGISNGRKTRTDPGLGQDLSKERKG